MSIYSNISPLSPRLWLSALFLITTLFACLALPASAHALVSEPRGWTDIATPLSHVGQKRPFVRPPDSPSPVVSLSSSSGSSVRIRLSCLPDDNQGISRDCKGSLGLWGYIPGYTKSKATWRSCGCSSRLRVGEFFGKRSYSIPAGGSKVVSVPMRAWKDDHRTLKVTGQRDAAYRANCGKREKSLKLLAQATATAGYTNSRELTLRLPREHRARGRQSVCTTS